MDAQSHQPRNIVGSEDFEKLPKKPVSRRALLKLGLLGTAATTLAGIDALAWVPKRIAHATPSGSSFSDIQFDIGNFIAPAQTINGVLFRFGPVFTIFLTAQLNWTPSREDQDELAEALNTIEAVYPFSPSGIFTFISYGLPYFSKLPGGLTGRLVSSAMPRLLSDNSRYALEEAVPSPTDVTPGGSITKQTFNVPVAIESNDVLFTFRSDHLGNIYDVVNWLLGSDELGEYFVSSPDFAFTGLFNYTTIRTQFTQIGLPRQVANQNNLPFAGRVNPTTPMWMGFSDQQVAASGPAPIVTFVGNSSARFTTATSGSYFDNGSMQHLSHVIQDLNQFYAQPAEPFTERVQYMFRTDPIPSLGNQDQFTDGGGTAFLANDASVFLKYQTQGVTEASQTGLDLGPFGDDRNPINDPEPPSSPDPNDVGKRRPRMGHLSALQISSRASDGTPVHIRMDGPGFSAGDVPDGSKQAKLQFTVFVPTADFFRTLRSNQAALQFQAPQDNNGNPTGLGVHSDDNGIERFLTATRRQNYLIPPRRNRAFPLVEFTYSSQSHPHPRTRKPLSRSRIKNL